MAAFLAALPALLELANNIWQASESWVALNKQKSKLDYINELNLSFASLRKASTEDEKRAAAKRITDLTNTIV